MEDLLPELVSHMLSFLPVSDRKEAALVCKKWYDASLDPVLQRDVVFKWRPTPGATFTSSNIMGRKLTHLTFGEWDSSTISEKNLVDFLSNCPSLVHLDLSRCNSMFIAGRLLQAQSDRQMLKETLQRVRELKLSCLRHMTDETFMRVVSVLENLESLSLASAQILFGNGAGSMKGLSPVVFQFSTLVSYARDQAAKLKHIDLSRTGVNDQSLEQLLSIDDLNLNELVLQGCTELSAKAIKTISSTQSSVTMLDISASKEVGAGGAFFSTLANNMPKLQVLRARKCPHLGQADTKSLADMGSLRTVDLGEMLNVYTTDLIKGLCSSYRSLTSIQLAYCSDICDMFVISLCNGNPTLRELDLTACMKLTDTSVHAISRKLTKLRSLRLGYCHGLTDLGVMGYMSEGAPVIRHSFEYDHDGCPCMRERDSRIFCKPRGAIKQMKSSIQTLQTNLDGVEELYKLSNIVPLRVLDLSRCHRITDLSLTEAIQFRELRTLTLNMLPEITDKGVEKVARNNRCLEEVNLRGCGKLTDQSVISLTNHCIRLVSIDISQNDSLTSRSLEAIMDRCHRLRHLDVSFCGSLPTENVMSLEYRCPNVKVVFRPHVY